MTIEEMKARKAELGYTNETIAELSGVPLGTVQKIFAGETRSPRYDTVRKLVDLLERPVTDVGTYDPGQGNGGMYVMEPAASYGYGFRNATSKRSRTPVDDLYIKPPKKTIGIADGKFKMPPDELFFDDEISDMFEDL